MHLSRDRTSFLWGGQPMAFLQTMFDVIPDPAYPQAHTLLTTFSDTVYWGLHVNFKGSDSHTVVVLCLHLTYGLCLDSLGGRI